MRYPEVCPATFLQRENRFIARVLLENRETLCHVKNTGRLGELLLEGAPVWLAPAANPARKTRWDLVTVQKGRRLVNVDSAAPNKVFREWLEGGAPFGPVGRVKAEAMYGASRLDFTFESPEGRWYAEVKGVTLEKEGVAYFPDAPTLRGVRHLEELAAAKAAGFGAAVVFVVQLEGITAFRPNDATHPAFGETLRRVQGAGVRLLALGCRVEADALHPGAPIEVQL